jgi:CHAT domain-containing protein
VHLATHGFAYRTDVTVRSSYVALAPDGQHTGLLTLGTLLDTLPPLSADLVVLSACETGLGQVAGYEGVVGFHRALLARGVRSVLVSLWSVDDRATSALMTRFYAHWLATPGGPGVARVSKAEALRRAQDDLRTGRDVQGWRSAWADPHYWGAFQLVGAP